MILSDLTTGQRIKKIRAHRGIINSLARSNAGHGIELVATASDDSTVKIWECGDEGSRDNVATWELGCPVTSVCWGPDGNSVFVGALDNLIHVRVHTPSHFTCLTLVQVYDLRKNQEVYALTGHTDTPTSISLSPDGTHILSPSLSSQTIIHDIRPFSPSPTRVHRILQGQSMVLT